MPTSARRASTGSSALQGVLADVLGAIQDHAGLFPRSVARTRLAISLSSGDHLELELDSSPDNDTEPAAQPSDRIYADHHQSLASRAGSASIQDLDLGATAKAAAEILLAQFPNDVQFTSGRRSISEQASAMAPNVVSNRRWIEQTYKASPQRTALQKWVDDHPAATSASSIAAGLESVMNAWTEAQQRNFSRHITGDAFDVQPVSGEAGKKIKKAIANLPKLHWHTFTEGGLEIWHAQFEP